MQCVPLFQDILTEIAMTEMDVWSCNRVFTSVKNTVKIVHQPVTETLRRVTEDGLAVNQ